MKNEQLQHVLKQNGQSSTHARTQVFEALHGEEPVSMAELVKRCAGIDRASVYRVVALFEKLGIVQRLQSGWKYKLELSDQFHDHHHHATCIGCGLVISLPEDTALEQHFQRLAASNQFALQAHQLELRGLCATCQKS